MAVRHIQQLLKSSSFRFVLLLVISLPLAGFASLLLYPTVADIDAYLSGTSPIFLIPEGYLGPVLIVYDQPQGQPTTYYGSARVYKIPQDGVLLTQFSPRSMLGDKFWYVNEQGQVTKEISWEGSCQADPQPAGPIVACVQGRYFILNGKRVPHYTSYIISPINQQEQFAKDYNPWLVSHLNSLTSE